MREIIKKYLTDHYADYVKDLEILTNIDSGNGDREGTEAANKFVAQHMEAMGATTEFRYNDRACHLISRLRGEGELTVLLVAHVDTVFNRGEAAKRPFRVDENGFAWGPGVGDDKATVMEVIYGLKALQEAGFKNFKEIIYYTNGEEEGGSKTAEEIVAELSQQSDFAIIMDVARPNWGIVTQRKSNAKYRVEVTGIGGHHGNASQHCANAIHQLAYTITEIHKLASPMPGAPEDFTAEALKARGIVDAGQFIPQNTVNVGVIGSTNDKISVIPGDAFCEVNIRCFSTAEQERIDKEIKALADKIVIAGTKVSITGGMVTGPMEKTPQVQKMVDVYKAVVKEEFGGEVNEWVAGGLTDGNRTAKFIPTLDALGVENYDEHTDHESVDLKTAVPRTAAFAITLAELTKIF
ncbi:MAG: M20/M25/M40 family metallo-hydrolase [Phascolarctobacterium sp.]|nr:M20/M25/M40 family metallo-hydrolase [Phascolarctobacterium sp.]